MLTRLKQHAHTQWILLIAVNGQRLYIRITLDQNLLQRIHLRNQKIEAFGRNLLVAPILCFGS
jgi:hypothetical protein